MQPLLQRARLFHSRDVDASRAFYDAKGTRFEPGAPGAAAPRIQVNGIYLANVWFGYVQLDGAVTLHLSPQSSSFRAVERGAPAAKLGDYYVYVPMSGRFEAEVGCDRVDCTPARGVAISPGCEQALRTHAGASRLSVSVRGETLNRQLAALLGRPLAAPVRFDPALRLEERHGRSLAGMLRWTAADFDADSGVLANPLVACQFEQFVMNWLLLAQPSNYSEALRSRMPPIAPRDVRRATDFIHANLVRPVTLPDLVRVAGVPGRTLLKHFRDVHGVSPMRYLRNRRMEEARSQLAAGSPQPVGLVAVAWGFAHPGRFAIEYRARFGESPSATLARSRRRS